MKSVFKLIFTVILSALSVASCVDIDKLSNNNTILGFTVLSHSPSTIELANPEVVNDTIYIPIVYGKYDFPMRFHAKLNFGEDISRIVGIDLSEEQCLENIDDVLKFHVMAKSGSTRTYYIKAREIPQDENNYISRAVEIVEVSPEKTLVSRQGVTSSRGDTLSIYTIEGVYPITITPRFDIAPLATLRNFDNGQTKLTFTSEQTIHKVKVISKSGAERVWNIALAKAPIVSAEDPTVSKDILAGTNIDPRTFTAANSGVEVTPFVDNLTENIELELKNKGAGEVKFPVDINLKFESFHDVQLFNIANDTTITFESYDDVHEFYMLDTESRIARHWKLTPTKWENSKKDVRSFTYNYTPSWVCHSYWAWPKLYANAITLDKNTVDIYPESGEIYLHMTEVYNVHVVPLLNKDNWKLTLTDVNMVVSDGATFTLPSLVWEKNDSWKTPKSFVVTAQDGSTKEWTLNIKDTRNYVESKACDLLDFKIEKIAPNYAKIDAMGTIVDEQTKTITIKLLEDEGCYPLSIFPEYKISPLATVSPNADEPLVFSSTTTIKPFTITAEDGVTQQQWNVKLQAPPREAQSDITDFKITSLTPSTFEINQVRRDNTRKVIEIEMNTVGAFPLTAGYTMSVSDKATASAPLRGTFAFDSYANVKRVTVTAEDQTTSIWTVKIVYTPQFANWQLDTWINNNTPEFWASANNTFIKGTSKTQGVSGSAAQLQSGKAPIVNTFAAGSIFTGWFDIDNAVALGLKDPVKLTHFGVPFKPSAKLLGVEAYIAYHPGNGATSDYGSATVYLINFNESAAGGKKMEFHGNKPGTQTPHPDNNAVEVLRGYSVFGLQTGTINDTPVTVVSDNAWTKIYIPLNYINNTIPTFTHMSICFSSSWKGDSFEGATGSIMKVDNIKLIYEE